MTQKVATVNWAGEDHKSELGEGATEELPLGWHIVGKGTAYDSRSRADQGSMEAPPLTHPFIFTSQFISS